MADIVYKDRGHLIADFLDHYDDYILTKFEHWWMANPEASKEKIETIQDFVRWLRAEAKEELVVKRGREGLSFQDIKEKCLKSV